MSEKKKYEYFERIDDSVNIITFRTSCDCHDPKHSLILEFEYDDDLKMESFAFYMSCELRLKHFQCKLKDETYYFKAFFRMLKERIFTASRVLFKGYLELDEYFIFKNQEQLDELCDIIQTFMPEIHSRSSTLEALRNRIKTLEDRLETQNGTNR